jgi:hypothetical protein
LVSQISWPYLLFAAECLGAPNTVGYTADDPQNNQILSLIGQISRTGPLKLLDFGGGEGRLLYELLNGSVDESDFLSKYDYYFHGLSIGDKLKTEIERLYNQTPHYTTSKSELDAKFTSYKLDLVVMCNVLHEIVITCWHEYLGNGSMLPKILTAHGYLLIVEDTVMPKGEYAHEFGFIVLNQDALRVLFSVTDEDIKNKHFQVHLTRDGRLMAALIHVDLVKRFNRNSLIDALKNALTRAEEHITQLRSSGDTSYNNGLKHAFFVQQFANLSLALKSLG